MEEVAHSFWVYSQADGIGLAEFLDDFPHLVVVPDGVIRGHAERCGAGLPEEVAGELVKGADEQVLYFADVIELTADFLGSLAVEGEVGDVAGVNSLLDHGYDPSDEGVCFAGTRSAYDQAWSLGRVDGVALEVVQRQLRNGGAGHVASFEVGL